jgi:histidine triad (HIT) family protein
MMYCFVSKKRLYFLIGICCLVGAICFYSFWGPARLSTEAYCAFCDKDVLDRQKFYEDDVVLALCTHKPILPGHCLIISKRHVERFDLLTDEEIGQIGRVTKRVHQAVTQAFKTSSYLSLQKNGLEVGQTVPHVHFHYIPREAGDDSTLKFLAKMYIANAQKPMPPAEMQKAVEKMKMVLGH